MVFTCKDLAVIYPEQLCLEFTFSAHNLAWHEAQNERYSNSFARWNAYLNRLAVNTLVNWFEEDTECESIALWPKEADLPSFWEVVNGTAVTLGSTKLVLIPSDNTNVAELIVPQEWVDIPDWAGNYYLAVQLNLEERWLRVWGYATHQQIRSQGRYEEIDRTYSLDKEDLVEDLNVLWVARELYPQTKPEVKPLPSFAPAQIDKILSQLSNFTPYSPRLDVPFEQWGALLASSELRQQLYQRRISQHQLIGAGIKQGLVQLGRWFEGLFESDWLSPELVLSPTYRSSTRVPHYTGIRAKNISSAPSQNWVERAKPIELEGKIVALVVWLRSRSDGWVDIFLRLSSAEHSIYLPKDLQMSVMDGSCNIVLESKARSEDNWLQMDLEGMPGDKFSVQITLRDVTRTENFVI